MLQAVGRYPLAVLHALAPRLREPREVQPPGHPFAPASGLCGDLVLLHAGLHETAHQLGLEKGIGVPALKVLDERHALRRRLVHADENVARHAFEPCHLRRHEPPVASDQRHVVVLVEHRHERLYHPQRLDARREVGHALRRNLPPRVPRRDLQQVDRYLPTLARVLRRLRRGHGFDFLRLLLLGRSLGLRLCLHVFTFRLPIPAAPCGREILIRPSPPSRRAVPRTPR